MLSLVWKDAIIQKRSWPMVVFLAALMHVAFAAVPSGAYSAGALAAAYSLILGACVYDEKNKSDVLWCSLPVKRRTIVGAKYVSALIFSLASVALSALTGAIMKGLNLPVSKAHITPLLAFGTIAAIAFFCALYFIVYFKYGYAKSRYFSVIIYVLMFFLPQLAAAKLQGRGELALRFINWLQKSGSVSWGVYVIAEAAVGLMLMLSYLISVRVYQNKDVI